MSPTRHALLLAPLLPITLLFAIHPGLARAAAVRIAVPQTLTQADSLAETPATPARDKALVEWAKHASVNDLAWMLDPVHPRLGAVEVSLLDLGFAKVPSSRAALRQRMLARRALLAARAPKRGEPPLPDLSALRPEASVFRLAVILPNDGEYAEYGRAVRAALAAGLAFARAPDALPFTLDTLGTADGDPTAVAEAFAAAAPRCDVIVGELLSQPTLSLATAATAVGMTLVSPTATDERIGRVGRQVLQVGPGPESRARVLADLVLGHDAHQVAIVGSASGIHSAFASAFGAEATARGGRVTRREPVRTGGSEITQQAQSLRASGADVLFWDGATRDLEALVRALAGVPAPAGAGSGAALRVCGGPTLAPDGMHASVRPLLEGVAWVADDWKLGPRARAYVDSAAAAAGSRPGSLWTRGFLAGRRIADAIDAGARTASEVAERLRHRDAVLAAAGLLECELDDATLPAFVVQRGKVVAAGPGGAQ